MNIIIFQMDKKSSNEHKKSLNEQKNSSNGHKNIVQKQFK